MSRDLTEFLERLALDAAPASGSAAAYGLAMAAALCEKVARRSPKVSIDVHNLQVLRARAYELMDDDERAVREMLAAGRVTQEAIEVPRRIGELAEELGTIAERLATSEKPFVRVDARGALELTTAAIAAAEAIIAANELSQ